MTMTAFSVAQARRRDWRGVLTRLDPILLLIPLALVGIGAATLYSAAGGSWEPWAARHLMRFALFAPLLAAALVVDLRALKPLSWAFYLGALALLVFVDAAGVRGQGAERWLSLGGLRFQPSEAAKLAVALAVAHVMASAGPRRAGHPLTLIGVGAVCALPVLLVLRQPDLGTALLIAAAAGGVVFAGGIGWRWITVFIVGAAVGGPLAAKAILKPYQWERITTFLEPERDPLGAGYHILQSKIALGSGGAYGRGFLDGTQGQLAYLPEMTTDFAFALFAEEFGFAGALVVLALYVALITRGLAIALAARSLFARLAGVGASLVIASYMVVNVAMVSGLTPVVGVPLPFVSYGGSAMLNVILCLAVLQIIHVRGEDEPEARKRVF